MGDSLFQHKNATKNLVKASILGDLELPFLCLLVTVLKPSAAVFLMEILSVLIGWYNFIANLRESYKLASLL